MSDINFCGNCGNKLVQGDLYCQNCGEKVTTVKNAEEIQEPPLANTFSPPPPPFNQQQTPTQYKQQYIPNQQLPKKSRSILPIILVILFVFLIITAAGGIIAYMYINNKTSETQNEVSTKVEKEEKKVPPVNNEQTTPKTETSKETEQENATEKVETENNDVSDVTGDSERNTVHDSKYFPGKYPEGSKIYLDESDLVVYYGKDELKIMRNEIFARHGYIFQTDDMRTYFSKQSWYKPERTNVDNLLSKIEKKNVLTIKSAEKQK